MAVYTPANPPPRMRILVVTASAGGLRQTAGALVVAGAASPDRNVGGLRQMGVALIVAGAASPDRNVGGLRQTAVASFPEFLVEDLADEAVEGDGVEADVGRGDHAGVDDLALGQLLQHALEMAARLAVLPGDLEILALQSHARGVAEAEDARHDPMVH